MIWTNELNESMSELVKWVNLVTLRGQAGVSGRCC